MKSLVEFIKESLDTQIYTHINESASVEAVLMFLNRWDGECVKICDLPDGTDGKVFAQELADEFDSEDAVIEYCDDCKCIIIKTKDCEDCDDCKKIKYAELFKESLSEDKVKVNDTVKDYNDNEWVVIDIFDVNKSNESDYKKFLKEYDGLGSQKDLYPELKDVKDDGYDYVVACHNADDKREVVVFCYGVGGVTKIEESLSEDEFKNMFNKVIKDWEGSQNFKHLEEIANDDLKLKKVYNDAKKIEQSDHINMHDALYHLIRNGKV